jgi:hypothetical protein
MFEAKEIGKNLAVAILAVMLGSTMILSAVGPARAGETTVTAASPSSPETVRYLA